MLTPDDINDLHTALDILTGAYAGGVDEPLVRDLLKQYAPGTPLGDRARSLHAKLDQLPHS